MLTEQEVVTLTHLARAEEALAEIRRLVNEYHVNTRDGVELTMAFANKLLKQKKKLRRSASMVIKEVMDW